MPCFIKQGIFFVYISFIFFFSFFLIKKKQKIKKILFQPHKHKRHRRFSILTRSFGIIILVLVEKFLTVFL
jgi:hypothetical protein